MFKHRWFVTWSAPTAYNQRNQQCLTPKLLDPGLGPGTTYAMLAFLLLSLAADGSTLAY